MSCNLNPDELPEESTRTLINQLVSAGIAVDVDISRVFFNSECFPELLRVLRQRGLPAGDYGRHVLNYPPDCFTYSIFNYKSFTHPTADHYVRVLIDTSTP